MAQALSDDQVSAELKKMTAFIKQEAQEKAHEIRLKADEEFQIEKSKLVRQEIASIDTQYEKKFKQASMSQQITRSTQSNKTRLKVLGARQELLDKLFEQAREKVSKAGEDKAYDETLKGLVLEGMYLLNEPKIGVRCKKADKEKLEKAAKQASEEFKKNVGTESEAQIDQDNFLPEDSAGGVFITASKGKVELDNTFEARLKMLEIEALPSVRNTLFGENTNRKFKD